MCLRVNMSFLARDHYFSINNVIQIRTVNCLPCVKSAIAVHVFRLINDGSSLAWVQPKAKDSNKRCINKRVSGAKLFNDIVECTAFMDHHSNFYLFRSTLVCGVSFFKTANVRRRLFRYLFNNVNDSSVNFGQDVRFRFNFCLVVRNIITLFVVSLFVSAFYPIINDSNHVTLCRVTICMRLSPCVFR